MKKTILLLLASVSCVLVSACYTTPEMDENKYRLSYEESEMGCNMQADYQHEGLRECIERRVAYDDAHKKTVTIVPTETGTLVVPKTYDDEEMMDTSRVYEVVNGKDVNVTVEEGVSPIPSTQETSITITETITEIEKEKVNEVVEDVKEVKVVEDVIEEEQTPALDEIDIDTSVEEQKVILDDTSDVVETFDAEGGVEAHSDDVADDAEEEQLTVEEKTVNVDSVVDTSKENNGQTVTFVVGPLKEDLVVSVKPADQQASSINEKETEKSIQKVKKVSTYKKSEKEVLPIEEK